VVNGERGTARLSKLPFVELAGKTGTSQVRSFSADQLFIPCNKRPMNQRHHGWFIGYAPADKPEIVVGVLAEHSCHGSSGAAPVAREMVRAYVAKYHPEWLLRASERKGLKRLANGQPEKIKLIEVPEGERIEGE
jgi:penicillin-binding protein 2